MSATNVRRWVPDVLRDAGEDENDFGYVLGVRESLDSESWALLLMSSNRAADEQEISLGWTLTVWSWSLVNDLYTAVSWSVNSAMTGWSCD
ncbi:MAG: hypothetical protein J2P54_05415 [Bradyrhizobiaceae bacterium]|nr:hypothetical protein [Bradyrhizobiaceae bacterium]